MITARVWYSNYVATWAYSLDMVATRVSLMWGPHKTIACNDITSLAYTSGGCCPQKHYHSFMCDQCPDRPNLYHTPMQVVVLEINADSHSLEANN